jgi:hypothetical protein
MDHFPTTHSAHHAKAKPWGVWLLSLASALNNKNQTQESIKTHPSFNEIKANLALKSA